MIKIIIIIINIKGIIILQENGDSFINFGNLFGSFWWFLECKHFYDIFFSSFVFVCSINYYLYTSIILLIYDSHFNFFDDFMQSLFFDLYWVWYMECKYWFAEFEKLEI